MLSTYSLTLIDAIESADWLERDSERAIARRVRLAEELIGALLDEHEHICALDTRPSSEIAEPYDARVAELIKKAFTQWVEEAEALLMKLAPLQAVGNGIKRYQDLRMANGVTKSSLRLAAMSIQKIMEQIRDAEPVDLEEMRRELRAQRGK